MLSIFFSANDRPVSLITKVARFLLTQGLAHMDACVFLNNDSQKMVIDRSGAPPLPLNRSGTPLFETLLISPPFLPPLSFSCPFYLQFPYFVTTVKATCLPSCSFLPSRPPPFPHIFFSHLLRPLPLPPSTFPLSNLLTGVDISRRFTFYDQVHTTGTDIKQVIDAKAVVTLGKDMTFRDFKQGTRGLAGDYSLFSSFPSLSSNPASSIARENYPCFSSLFLLPLALFCPRLFRCPCCDNLSMFPPALFLLLLALF
jgi:hypothetical protein